MAFIGRGNAPSFGNGGNNDIGDNVRRHMLYRYRMHYYIPLDNTYVLMQMVATICLLVVGVITYVSTYKSTIVDPIENIKATFLNTYLIGIIGFVLITIIFSFFSKSKQSLIKKLVVILCISLITMIVFLGIKINLDSTYTKDKFEKIYLEQNNGESSDAKTKVKISLSEMKLESEKEYYIDECVKLYNIFKTKAYTFITIHLLLNVIIIYRIFKESKDNEKRKKLEKDDLIIFDEEQNCRY